jgi:polysaccharide biosynthesis protein PslL
LIGAVAGSAAGAGLPLGNSSRKGSLVMKRQIWIDVLKGLGIIAVVVGHVTYNPLLAQTIFMFHMPLFFLIGGYLHKTGMGQGAYLKAKTRSLLVPYLSFLVILWPLEVLVAFPGQPWTGAWILTAVIGPLVAGGQHLKGFGAVFWFVTCYFLTQQLVHFLLRRYTMVQCALVCAVMLVLAYLNGWLLRPWSVAWNANAVLMAAPLYFIGYWARGRKLGAALPAAALVTAVALGLNVLGYHNTFDIKSIDYGFPVVTLVSALAAVALLAWCAQRLQSNLAGRALAAIGGASMTIMFLHQFVQLMMAKKLGIVQAGPRIAVALLVCFLVHQALKRSPLAARFFLGVRAPEKLPSPAQVAGQGSAQGSVQYRPDARPDID